MIGVFTDQAYNLILLAEDEARMLSADQVTSYALRVGANPPPQPGPIPPVFERFTAQARTAIDAAGRSAQSLASEYVEPFHLLLGVLDVPEGVAATVLARHHVTLDGAMARARVHGPGPSHQATGIFTDAAAVISPGERWTQALFQCGARQRADDAIDLASVPHHD